MRLKLCAALRVIVFTALLALVISAIEPVVMIRHSEAAYSAGRMEPKDSVDVVFIGTSHMNYAVYPMQLYEETGIKSINAASNGQPVPLSYYAAEEMIRLQHPKLIVMDLYYIYRKTKTVTPRMMHSVIDQMVIPSVRFRCIFDIVPKKYLEEFIWPFSLYHSRWKTLDRDDYLIRETNLTKGATVVFHEPFQGEAPEFELLDPADVLEPKAVLVEYIERLAELCKKTDTRLLLTVAPFCAYGQSKRHNFSNDQRYYNWMAKWAEERGIPMYNMLYDIRDMGLDFVNDMRDRGHLNYTGGVKATRWMGKFLKEHYELTDWRGDEAWDAALARWKAYVAANE